MDPTTTEVGANVMPTFGQGRQAEELLSRLAHGSARDELDRHPFGVGSLAAQPVIERRRPVASVPLDQLIRRASLIRRAWRGLTRFLLAAGIGAAATLAWQSYGDTAKLMIPIWSPQLSSFLGSHLPSFSVNSEITSELPSTGKVLAERAAPQTKPLSETVPVASEPSTPSPVLMSQIDAITRDLAATRQRMDELAANQEQVTGALTKLQSTEQEILQKIAAPPPRPAAPAVRSSISPAPPRSARSSSLPPPPPVPLRP